MGAVAAWSGTVRTYTRSVGEEQQDIRVNVDPNGRIRMTADSLHHLLTQLGFAETTKEPTP